MTSEWILFKEQLFSIPELAKICDLAAEAEHLIYLVQLGINRGNVRPDYFYSMKVMLYRLSTEAISTVRKYNEKMLSITKSTSTKQIKEIETISTDLKNRLEMQELKQDNITTELTRRPVNFPNISDAIGRVEEILSILKEAMQDVINYRSNSLMFEFVLCLIKRRGITVSPETLKEYEKAKGGEAV